MQRPGPLRTIPEKIRNIWPKPGPTWSDPQICRSIFGYWWPNRPYNQLRLAIPCRGSRSKFHFGPREAPSGPKPYFWDGPVSAPRKIFRRCEGFQALRPIFRRCEGFSGAAKDFQALRRIFRRCGGFSGAAEDFQALRRISGGSKQPMCFGGGAVSFFSGKMLVLEKRDLPYWYFWSIWDRF